MLDDELKTANNIKSRANRHSVVESIKHLNYYLKSLKSIPENGLALFSGECTEITKEEWYV
jgi:peptide subunit release factor 1 (eRF1)